MSTLTEQFSAARKSQVEAQIDFFQSFTANALESAQKLMALNLSVSRASIEKSSAAAAELLTVKDPRDLFALAKHSQESINSLVAYNRTLVAIATGAGATLAKAAVPVAPESTAPSLALVKPTPEPESTPATAELVAPVAEPEPAQSEPAALEAAPLPSAAKPIAKAISKDAAGPAVAKPAAAPVPAAAKKVVVTGLKPVDATPPPAQASGKPALSQQQPDLPTAKAKKKK